MEDVLKIKAFYENEAVFEALGCLGAIALRVYLSIELSIRISMSVPSFIPIRTRVPISEIAWT